MKTREQFKEIISDSFWRHIRKKSYIPSETTEGRNNFCDRLYTLIENREYHPSLPREYVISDKHNGATRLIPVFSLEDTAVYYYCVKSLEDYLVAGYVDCTFGGFQLGGAQRGREDDVFNEINAVPVYGSMFSYNPAAWANEWRSFQLRAYQISREHILQCFVLLDISNFYPTINLTLLENKIRNVADKTLCDEIDLLFYFLRHWDRKASFYAPKSIGLPMDDFGDSSRLLANFFLQDYDKKIYDFCKQDYSRYLRYADDQIICTQSQNATEKALRFASLELSRIGLNINSGKIKHFGSKNDFEKYWAFDIFTKLDNPLTLEEGIKDFLVATANKDKIRWISILRRIIGCDLSGVDIAIRSSIFAQAFDPKFLKGCDHRYLLKLYNLLDSDTEKKKFLATIKKLADECLYTEFHYAILGAKKLGLPVDFEKEIQTRIMELRFTI